MIYSESLVNVVDNCGVKEVRCIHKISTSIKKYVSVGDIFVGVVTKISKKKNNLLKKGSIVKCYLIRSKKKRDVTNAHTGILSKNIYGNDCVILKKNKVFTPEGYRLNGPVPYKVRYKNGSKIISMCNKIY